MKPSLSPLLLMLAVAPAVALRAEPPPGPPRLSPMATTTQVVGVSEVTVTYSRPATNGRTIWGELVPWNQVWRTGANEATRIRFSHDVKVQGQPLFAGTYGLFTIPTRDEWILVFSRDSEQWGAFSYDPAHDALRVEIRPREAPFQERLEITYPEVGFDTVTVQIHWERVALPFEVTFDVRKAAIQEARELVAAATPADGRMVWNWANYFYQNGFNTKEALGWATSLAEAAPMYWTHALHARLLEVNGRTGEAVEAARRALERARKETDQPGIEADAEQLAEQMEAWRAAG